VDIPAENLAVTSLNEALAAFCVKHNIPVVGLKAKRIGSDRCFLVAVETIRETLHAYYKQVAHDRLMDEDHARRVANKLAYFFDQEISFSLEKATNFFDPFVIYAEYDTVQITLIKEHLYDSKIIRQDIGVSPGTAGAHTPTPRRSLLIQGHTSFGVADNSGGTDTEKSLNSPLSGLRSRKSVNRIAFSMDEVDPIQHGRSGSYSAWTKWILFSLIIVMKHNVQSRGKLL